MASGAGPLFLVIQSALEQPGRTAAQPKTMISLTDCPPAGTAGDADRAYMRDKNYSGRVGSLPWGYRLSHMLYIDHFSLSGIGPRR